jgi:hypothetical protein
MSVPTKVVIQLYTVVPFEPADIKVIAEVQAHKVVICSQYADLRDAEDKLVATITWTSPVQVRRLDR